MDRRSFFKSLVALAATPAIARVAALFPARAAVREIYNNRTMRVWVDVKSIRDRNVLLQTDDYAGPPQVLYRSIPLRVLDDVR